MREYNAHDHLEALRLLYRVGVEHQWLALPLLQALLERCVGAGDDHSLAVVYEKWLLSMEVCLRERRYVDSHRGSLYPSCRRLASQLFSWLSHEERARFNMLYRNLADTEDLI